MENLFNLDDLLADSGKGTKIPCGIHTDVSVSSISRKKTPKGNEFIEIVFSKGDASIQKALWEPKGSYLEKEETTEQALAREARLNLSHIAKLLKLYLTPEQLANFPNLGYHNFMDKAIAILTPLLPTKKVNLKVIYDKEGVYTDLGKYPDYMELYQEGVEPTLAFTDFEIQNRTTSKEKKADGGNKKNLEDLLSTKDDLLA